MQIFKLLRCVIAPRLLACFIFAAAFLSSQSVAQYLQTSARFTLVSMPASALTSAVDTGVLPTSQPMQVTLTLVPTLDRVAALDQFLTDVITPSTASYHQWVTPATFGSTYGVTDAQIAGLSAWAQSEGLSVSSLSTGRTLLGLSGTVAQMESAFAVTLHSYHVAGVAYYATPDQASLPTAVFSSVAAISGLSNLPAASAMTVASVQTSGAVITATTDAFTAASTVIDQNTAPILNLISSLCASDLVQSQMDQYRTIFRQASAEGITVLTNSACSTSGSFPASLAEVTAVTLTGTANDTDPRIVRPAWQTAPGLPATAFRMEPDLTTPSLSAFAQTIATIVGKAGVRQGNINANLYKLAPIPGLYTQPDSPETAGTWEATTGLGTVDLRQLIKAYPYGTGPSSISLTISNYAPTHGASVSFTGTMASESGGGAPTGTISFVTSTNVTLGTATLASGTASYTTNALAAGSYTITAEYSGDSNYAAINSGTSSISVQPEASQLAAVVSTGNIVGGTLTVAVTDTVTFGQPSGLITVSMLGVNYTGTLVATTSTASAVTISIPASTVGTATLSITCATTATYTCYNPVTTTVVIGKATPVLKFFYTPTPAVSGGTLTLKASLAAVGTAAVPSGNVEFFDNMTVLNASVLTNGATSTTGVVPTTSSHTISATYDGDANYNSVTSTSPSTSTGTGATSVVLTPSSTTVATGVTITFTAVIAAATVINSTAPSGTVAFYDSTTLLSSATISGSSATYSTSSLSTATAHSITAVYSGDTNYAGSTSNALLLAKNSGLATAASAPTSSPSNPTYASPIALSTTITTTTGGGTPTGTVQFFSASTVLCTATLTGSTAVCSLTSIPAVGSFPVEANYLGDATFASSTSVTKTVTVSVATANLAATISPTTSIAAGGSATITTIVTLPNTSTVPPSGSITATITGVAGGVYSTVLPGTAGTTAATVTIPITGPVAGSYTISVTCTGNANYACAPVSLPLITTGVIPVATTTSLTYSPATPYADQSITLTATVAVGTTTTKIPTGTVQFLDGTTSLGTATINTAGIASLVVKLSGVAHSLTAVYAGDTNFTTSTSAAVSLTPATIASSVALTSNVTSTVAGFGVIFTAQVSGLTATGVIPTGTVSFYDLHNGISNFIGTGTLSAAGSTLATASLTITSLQAGTHTIDAVYAGNANFATATSPNITVTIADYSAGFNPASLTLTQGASGSSVLTLAFSGGFTGAVSFSCTPPADTEITCSFLPTTLSGAGTTILTVNTTAARTIGALRPGSGPFVVTSAALAGLLCLVLPGRRRRRLIPTLLLLFVALGLGGSLGCGGNVETLGNGGTPFGTNLLSISTASSVDGITDTHNLTFQVTVQ